MDTGLNNKNALHLVFGLLASFCNIMNKHGWSVDWAADGYLKRNNI